MVYIGQNTYSCLCKKYVCLRLTDCDRLLEKKGYPYIYNYTDLFATSE